MANPAPLAMLSTSPLRRQAAAGDKAPEAAAAAGRLPHRRPDRMWAGRSTGTECAACGAVLERDDIEYELEFALDGELDRYHVHMRCYTAFIASLAGA